MNIMNLSEYLCLYKELFSRVYEKENILFLYLIYNKLKLL